MHLVFLNQYYPPDAAPTGVMLAAVVEELATHGHEVTVICAEGGYAGRKRKTPRRKTQEGTGREGFKHPSHLSPSARGEKKTKIEDVTAVCDRRSECEEDDPASAGRPAADEAVRMRKSDPTVLRIRATRFGRGTFLGKVVDYLSYYVGVAWKLMWLRPRPERIVALTTPPYLSVLARVFSKLRGGDHAHWVMDLYPDVMVAHGMLRAGSLAQRLLAGMARWGFGGRRCAALLTLGPDMAERLEGRKVKGLKVENAAAVCDRRGGCGGDYPAGTGPAAPDEMGRPKPSDPTWIPLWEGEWRKSNTSKDEEEGMALAKRRHARGWREDELVVMYSGNMGLGHRFEEILEVIGKGDESACLKVQSLKVGNRIEAGHLPSTIHDPQSPTRFVFFGGGKRRGEIERFVAEHPDLAVELHDYAPAEDLGIHLRSADVHLASLAAEWTGTMVPSKLQGIFHAARPVVFIGDAKSSIGRWVIESGGGWLVAPGDVDGLERAIDEARNPAVRESRGRAAKAFAEANFDKQANVRRVTELLACSLV